jgi:predicted amidohydrolase YtcJ
MASGNLLSPDVSFIHKTRVPRGQDAVRRYFQGAPDLIVEILSPWDRTIRTHDKMVEYFDSGARLAGGSDFPVEPPNPFYGLHAAVTRQSRDGAPPQGWRMAEAMTMQQAFAAFTTGAAWAGHAEGKVGTLTPGKWADFIITGQDPFAVAPADVWRVRVDETWLGGKRVFLRK